MRRRTSPGRIATLAAAALLLSLWVGIGAASSSASAGSTGADYLDRLERARALAEQGIGDPRPETMDAVRETAAPPTDLAVPGGVVRLGPDPFLASLVGDESEDFRRAEQHLLAMAEAVRRAEEVPALDPAAVRLALSRSYVGISGSGPLQRLIAEATAILVGLLGALLDPLTHVGFGSVLAWGVVLGVAVAVVAILRRLGVGVVPERATARAPAFEQVDWQAVADEAVRRGDLREATRAFYHALVAALASRGIVAGDLSTTAGECRAAVARSLPGLYPSVVEATSVFERVAYGGSAPVRTEIEPMLRAIRESAA